MSGDDCVFCDRIGRDSYNGRSDVYGVVWFLPIDRYGNPSGVNDGHTLIVPIVHVTDFAEHPVVTANTFGCAAWLADQLRSEGRLASANLITSWGSPATQTVKHLHVHLVPRVEGDGLHLPWTGQVRP